MGKSNSILLGGALGRIRSHRLLFTEGMVNEDAHDVPIICDGGAIIGFAS